VETSKSWGRGRRSRRTRLLSFPGVPASQRGWALVNVFVGKRRQRCRGRRLVGLARIELATSALSGRTGKSRIVSIYPTVSRFGCSLASRDFGGKTRWDSTGRAGTQLLGSKLGSAHRNCDVTVRFADTSGALLYEVDTELSNSGSAIRDLGGGLNRTVCFQKFNLFEGHRAVRGTVGLINPRLLHPHIGVISADCS